MKEKIISHGERQIQYRIMDSFGDMSIIEWFEEGSGRFHKWLTRDKIHNGACPFGSKRMQRTGLHDKNGTKIYDGDIVEFENMGCSIKVGEVVFSNGGFEAYKKGYKKRGLNTVCMVIGNKYQNAYLLSE